MRLPGVEAIASGQVSAGSCCRLIECRVTQPPLSKVSFLAPLGTHSPGQKRSFADESTARIRCARFKGTRLQ